MMPTNEERREVATRLRVLADENTVTATPSFNHVLFAALGGEPPATPSIPTLKDLEAYDWALLYRLADLIEPEPVSGETSDGYHTFNELYHHRALLFSVIVRNYTELCWKSKRHHTGDMYEGMFIVGINTPDGQASYHYDIEPYWDMFDCEELESAPEWDGHTPDQAIERIGKLMRNVTGRTCRMKKKGPEYVLSGWWECDECGLVYPPCNDEISRWALKYCPHCGAKVVEE